MNLLLPRASLNATQRNEMFTLLDEHFEGVTRIQFDRDLDEKDWVVQIRQDDRLVGFTTLLVREVLFHGKSITAIYSGDTIVAPEAWSSPALSRAWIASVNQIKASLPERPCYWLLLTSGFRTYRFLPLFWKEFHPMVGRTIPESDHELLDLLASIQYGSSYNPSSGIVRFANPQRLRGRLNTLPPGRQSNPHIAYFLKRNPGHTVGDELVCLTEIIDGNLTAAGRRMMRQ